ncbi:MAG: MBL fold metallo-hydrolase [Clostridia bacterium]|nr:MBL fold metallo-hydrolase [Clostridia bacterium]
MKIKYLGTAAAEGIPALFCECDNCKKARALGGRNVRTRSQALIDDKLLIDFPADTYMHYLQYNFPLQKIHSCLITHSHSDHLYEEDLEMRIDGFAHLTDKTPMVFYSDTDGYNRIKAVIDKYKMTAVEVRQIELNKPFKVEDYTVTAIRAAHGASSSPVVYIIEKDGKTLFYSNDTSEYPEESWAYLKTLNKPLDMISLDCTEAMGKCTYVGHLTFDRCVALREELKRVGVADDKTRFVLTHFSHNGVDVTYDKFSKIAGEKTFLTAYDGLEVEF